jgi:S-DNA-T family DNA segregation ATPase FtsK/SpoIIIE
VASELFEKLKALKAPHPLRALRAFFARPDCRFRLASLFAALSLGLVGILLGVSIAGAVFNIPDLAAGPGDFLVRSYGVLGFIIPLYLLAAAVILADPHFRPDRIFILTGATFPFLTLAIGFAFLRDFNIRSQEWEFLARTGRIGFSLIIIFMVVIESFLIMALTTLFFPGPEAIKSAGEHAKPRDGGSPLLLPNLGVSVKEKPPAPAPGTAAPVAAPPIQPELDPFFETFFDNGKETGDDGQGTGDDGEETGDDGQGIGDDGEFLVFKAPETLAEDDFGSPASYTSPTRKAPKAKRRSVYSVPVEGILNQYPDGQYWIIDQTTRDAAVILKNTLEEFKIQAEVTGIRKGPVITMFEILPAPGIRLTKIESLADNIAMRLAAHQSVRIVAPIPGKQAVGIEVPNVKRNIVSFREIIEGELRREKDREGKKMEIPIVLGKDITGEAVATDLVLMPHLLIAGATGSGKSVCVNTMILSILYQRSPADCRLILIDPKIVELKLYNDIPHLLTPVITEPKKAFQALQYCIYEMERRYACLDSMGVRDIRSYNRRIKERNMAAEHMPYIVVVIDEFADLMAITGKELESTVARLAAMSRAVGIHLVLATQRPSIDVITGLIKANIPSRIAFMVASMADSRIIVDKGGAEKLLGKGDMLYAGVVDPFPIRMQGAFVSEEEVERVVEYVKTLGEPDYIDDEIFIEDDEDLTPSLFAEGDDPLYEKALEIVMQQGKASASYIQRRLKIGYNRAARLVEEMEHRGVVGPAQGSKPRELLRGV